MQRHHPTIPFERYVDDVICHCRSEEEAQTLLVQLGERLGSCKLQLHPTKTQIVYCKDGKRRGSHARTRFDFLGFTFQARSVQDRQGNLFVGFSPAVSRAASKRMKREFHVRFCESLRGKFPRATRPCILRVSV